MPEPNKDLWYVDPKGHQWLEPEFSEAGKMFNPMWCSGPFLIPVNWRRPFSLAKSYPLNPFKFDALFHRLATTPPTKEGIVEFANKYGMLGLWSTVPVQVDDRDGRALYTRHAESISVWAIEIFNISFAYRCWAAIRRDDEGELAAIAHYVSTGEPSADWRTPDSAGTPHEQLPRWMAIRGMGNPAANALENLITVGLRDRFSGVLTRDDEGTGWEVEFGPTNLIGAIWRQFALAVATEVWKDCRHCGAPFKPKNRRGEYCSQSHRQLAYRKRKTKGESK